MKGVIGGINTIVPSISVMIYVIRIDKPSVVNRELIYHELSPAKLYRDFVRY